MEDLVCELRFHHCGYWMYCKKVKKVEKMVRVIKYINKRSMCRTWRWASGGGWWGKLGLKKGEKMAEGEGGLLSLEKGSKRRYSPGMVALHEIRKFQKSTSFLMRKLLFVRLVREITQQIWGNLRFHAMTLLVLQEAVEVYVVNLFDVVYLCAIHGKCITMMPNDIQVTWRIWGDMVKYLPR